MWCVLSGHLAFTDTYHSEAHTMPVQVPFKVSKGLMVLKLRDLAFICHNILSQDVNNGSNVIIRLLDHSTWEEFPPYLNIRIISSLAYIHCLLHTQLLLNTIKIIFNSKRMICVLTSRGNDCHQILPVEPIIDMTCLLSWPGPLLLTQCLGLLSHCAPCQATFS